VIKKSFPKGMCPYLVRSRVPAHRRRPLERGRDRGVNKESSIFSEEESECNFESTRACVDWKKSPSGSRCSAMVISRRVVMANVAKKEKKRGGKGEGNLSERGEMGIKT